MSNKLTAQISIKIGAPAAKVWKVFTDPAMVKQFMFGTNIETDWKKGSPLIYTGEWQGKQYRDKGVIVDIVPEKLLHSTYLSSMSGKEDKPENYNHIIYELKEQDGATVLTVRQTNINSEDELMHSEKNWSMVIEKIKKLAEG